MLCCVCVWPGGGLRCRNVNAEAIHAISRWRRGAHYALANLFRESYLTSAAFVKLQHVSFEFGEASVNGQLAATKHCLARLEAATVVKDRVAQVMTAAQQGALATETHAHTRTSAEAASSQHTHLRSTARTHTHRR